MQILCCFQLPSHLTNGLALLGGRRKSFSDHMVNDPGISRLDIAELFDYAFSSFQGCVMIHYAQRLNCRYICSNHEVWWSPEHEFAE
jgi:hypothetical protein